jgi:hypothetical protein
MSFSIREATIDDAVLIADISHQTFYDSFAADNTKEDMDKFLHEQFTRGKLMLEVGARDNTFFLLTTTTRSPATSSSAMPANPPLSPA